MRTGKLVVIGQGYVGLPVAMSAARAGFQVIGIDVDESRIRTLQSGRSFVEDISDETLADALQCGGYQASTNYDDAEGFDFAVITVPTPLKESLPDLTFIEQSASAIGEHLTPGATVVLESTTYPGTTEERLVPILEAKSALIAGRDFFVGYSPERIDPGNKEWTFEKTPKVVSGINQPSLERVAALYERLVERIVRVSTPKEAELTKLLENTFRHVNIALVNELAIFAHQLDIDVWEAIEAANTKPFGYMRFTPGPGVGGHCLPVDPSYLSWEVKRKLGQSFRFIELANDVNDHMPDYVVQRTIAGLNRVKRSVNGADILLVGLAYKPNTGDIRESPALRVMELLADLGANLYGVDHHVEEYRWPSAVTRMSSEAASARKFEAAIVMTNHDDFRVNELIATSAYVLDARNCLPESPAVERL